MTKKDLRSILVVGAAVGLLIQPIIANVLPQISLGILGRVVILIFFMVLAPCALWIAYFLSRLWKGLYQFAQFAAVGTLNSFIDVGVFNLETFLYGTAAVSTATFAAFKAVSFLCATTNSFFWNKYWTFSGGGAGAETGSKAKEAISFYVVAGIGWAVNVGVATVVKLLEPSGVAARIWVNIVAPVCGIGASFLWDFWGYKHLVFKK